MTDVPQVDADLGRAAADRQEHSSLTRRLQAAAAHLESEERRLDDLRHKLLDETGDVEKLESFSPTKIWAVLKGSHAGDLERETAEREAARYELAVAEARRDVAQRDRDSVQARLNDLGDVEGRYARALTAKEEWVAANGGVTAAALAEIAERRGTLLAQDKEAREAFAAGAAARDLLTHAQELLGSAQSWSTWDTFGGGGLLSDMAKYDKIDQATEVLRRADLALTSFSQELADVGLPAMGSVRIDDMTRAFDIFFDNIFSDMAVRSRIQNAGRQVEDSLRAVHAVLSGLGSKGQEIAQELAQLDARREAMLSG
ncbi:MAG: hypothetical protein ACRDPJ_04535 [Nocardioidaceae bacterium]